jgi:hypothetical protein
LAESGITALALAVVCANAEAAASIERANVVMSVRERDRRIVVRQAVFIWNVLVAC